MHLTTDGIVLRDYKTQEDRILTILTAKGGVITAFANGANKLRSKLASSTELLCYSEFVLFTSRDKNTVDKAEAHRVFFGIRGDLVKLSLASYFAQLAIELAPHGESADAYLKLLLNTLHCLERGSPPDNQLKALYELRMLTLSGYMPNLVACRECGGYESPLMHFLLSSGELVCETCFAGGNPTGVFPLPPGVLAAMRHITYAPPEKLFSFTLSDEGLSLLSRVCEDYLLYQTEKTFPSLEFYRQMKETP